MKYIDAHGHVYFAAYDADRAEVIKRAQDAEVGIVSVGVDLESSKKCIELAENNSDSWAIIGMHPTNTAESFNDKNETGSDSKNKRPAQLFEYDSFLELAKHPKVVAIGECGLDYFHSKPEDIAKQKEVFIQHINLANEVEKPLMLHVRNAPTKKISAPVLKVATNSEVANSSASVMGDSAGKVELNSAYLDALEILKEHTKVPFNFHFFAGSLDEMSAALNLGALFSFTGVITFTKDYDELIRKIPLDRMMSETDCPYVAPIPFRGKRSEPIHAIEVVKAISRIRGEDEEKVREEMLENARRFFNI